MEKPCAHCHLRPACRDGIYCSRQCFGAAKKRTLRERFIALWQKGHPEKCWPWQGTIGRHGYGVIKDENNRSVSTHRLAYAASKGDIPAGLSVLHSCDNPPCCNPSHLFVGTNTDNQRDKKMKGRGRYHRGAKHHASKLTENDIRRIRKEAKTTSHRRIAKAYRVSRQTIDRVVKGETWGHV